MSTLKYNTWLNTDNTENYKCRAWVNFNGTGTVAIRASGNVSSITDLGTGQYRINFTTAMPDANYAVTISVANISTNISSADNIGVQTTGYFQWEHVENNSVIDISELKAAVFR